jgi:hypothetical protein
MPTPAPTLSARENDAVEAVADSRASVESLVKVFGDPRDAFVYSPVALSMRQLCAMYMDHVSEEERHRMPAMLRDRARSERWQELRAEFQAKRYAARSEEYLKQEARVWAVLGIEFHATRMRALMERWEALRNYVQDGLDACEAGTGSFTQPMRDAVTALNQIENEIAELLPRMGMTERAGEVFTQRLGERATLVKRITEAAANIASDRGARVFDKVSARTTSGE